jgi:hypothetical protein
MPLIEQDMPGTAGSRPAVICDGCGKEIMKAEEGLYTSACDKETYKYIRQMLFFHQRPCFDVARRKGEVSGWEPLGWLMMYLAHNLQWDPVKGMKDLKRMAEQGFSVTGDYLPGKEPKS